MKWFWVVLGVVVAGLIGIFALGNHPSTPSASTGDPLAITAADHIEGAAKAKVTLIEYGDFQCPSCGAAYPLVKNLQKSFGTKLRLVFRNFPLVQLHPNALAAARAAEAANLQGKFFAMYDKLFSNQNAWAELTNAPDTFKQYAKDIGLDVNKFEADYTSQGVIDRVNTDIATGQALKITGTPTFYVNGEHIELNQTSDLKNAINSALKS